MRQETDTHLPVYWVHFDFRPALTVRGVDLTSLRQNVYENILVHIDMTAPQSGHRFGGCTSVTMFLFLL